MPRISGVDLPENKRCDTSLCYLYGIGRTNIAKLLTAAKIDPAKRAKDLTDEEIARIQKVVDTQFRVEGDLRKEVLENIKRLKQIGSYRGRRHSANLPSRGQRTRSNARTRRGRRLTIGALRKDDLLKKQQAEAEKTKTAAKTK